MKERKAKKQRSTEAKLYGIHDRIGLFLSHWRNREVLPLIKGKLVDLSCGDNRLVSEYENGVGVDVIDHGNTDFVLANYDTLPFETASVGTVTIIASLNYFDKPVTALREVNRILADDGCLITTMTNPAALKIWHKVRDSKGAKGNMTAADIEALLKDSGFVISKQSSFMLHLNRIYVAVKSSLN